jgi:hypothetical protein
VLRPFLPISRGTRLAELREDPSLPSEARMATRLSRRGFLARSIAAGAAIPAVMSVEEHRLLAAGVPGQAAAPAAGQHSKRWMGKIGSVSISRLICGGNLISGFAHSRDLIYVSPLLKHYHTEAKVMETWALCEEHGINTMIAYAGDRRAVTLYRNYRKRGGKIQYLAQINPDPRNLRQAVTEAIEADAVGAFLVGNAGDQWAREKAVGRIAEVVGLIRDADLIAGVAGHELRTPRVCEAGSVEPDFYVKTLHDRNYWSKQQPGQDKDVIDNYAIDNYWCREPEKVIGFMGTVARPWIAYKVLAAGAIHPKDGFKYAFQNGADFACVGMFDFQVAENVRVANAVLTEVTARDRAWRA